MPLPIQNTLLFLITTLFDLYAFILTLRLLLVLAGFNYFEPIVRFVITLTDFLVRPVRRFLPTCYRIELASFFLLFLLLSLKFLLMAVILQKTFSLTGLFILSISHIFNMIILTFTYAIIIQAILSFIQPYSSFNRLLYQLNAPLIRPLQRIFKPINAIDITPVPALIGLQVLSILLINPLMYKGFNMVFGS